MKAVSHIQQAGMNQVFTEHLNVREGVTVAARFIYRITTNSPHWPILELPNYVVYSTKALQCNSLECRSWPITAICWWEQGFHQWASETTDLITNIMVTDVWSFPETTMDI